MDDYIQITKLNDFMFCPYSLYVHSMYEGFDTDIYHGLPQTRGRIVHKAIDNQTYSTAKDVLQGLPVYSQELQVAGKIDLYFVKKKLLMERKYRIVRVYDGYRLQLYAQYYCMREMGYEVRKLSLHSMSDNKTYDIQLPKKDDLERIKGIIKQMRNFDISNVGRKVAHEKCKKCIYRGMCVFSDD